MCRRQRVLVAPLRLHLYSRWFWSFHFEDILQRLTDVHVDKPVEHKSPSNVTVDVEEEQRDEDSIEELVACNQKINIGQKSLRKMINHLIQFRKEKDNERTYL